MKKARFVSTQNRLSLVFTLLFLIGVVILTSFIGTSIRAMGYNADAHTTYTEVRQFYQVAAYMQQYMKSLNSYELTVEYDTLSEYNSSYARLQQSLANLAAHTELPGEKQILEEVAQDITTLREGFDAVIQAASAEDWPRVVELDGQVYGLVQPITDQIEDRIQVRNDALAELRDEVDTFTTLSWVSIALALPFFLAVVVVVVWIVARQIHSPVIRLTDELKRIEEGGFDPAALAALAERRDEVGYLAREYLQMASAVLNRRAGLQQEAAEIRAKIR